MKMTISCLIDKFFSLGRERASFNTLFTIQIAWVKQ